MDNHKSDERQGVAACHLGNQVIARLHQERSDHLQRVVDSISHWKSLNISSVTFNNSTGDGNLNILVNHTDGTSRIIVFSATGISYYENSGSGNVRKWQYIGS